MQKTLVLLLGPHRSGSSLGAQSFARGGLPMGDRLILEPTPDNLDGYWEDRDVVGVHSALAAALYGEVGQGGTNDPDYVSEAGGSGPAWDAARSSLGRLLQERFRTSPVYGVKDPRAARYLPLWLEVAGDLGLDIKSVLFLRRPAGTASSLLARDDLPAIFGELLWLRYTVNVLRHTARYLTAVLTYETWFTDPAENCRRVAEVVASLGLDAHNVATAYKSDLVHHGALEAQLPVCDAIYDALATAPGGVPTPQLAGRLVALADHFVHNFGGWASLHDVMSAPALREGATTVPVRSQQPRERQVA